MSALPESTIARLSVLVVDDDEDLRLTLADYLQSWNFSVSTARSGREAIELIERRPDRFDIVLTDLVMPGCSGLDVVKAAKGLGLRTHVVVMTGFSSVETALDSIRAGAFDYIAKPFQIGEIEVLVNRVLEHKRLIDENRRLSRQVALLSEQSHSLDARLDRIEAFLSRLCSNIGTDNKTLTQ